MSEVIVVHTIDDIRRAFATATSPLTLQSAPDAIFYAGALYLLAMFREACAEYPEADAVLILDCGDAGAQAVSAMQMGHTHIKSCAPEPLRSKLADIARQMDVVFMQD